MTCIFAALGLLWLGWVIGWAHAHSTIAVECRKLGAFYVGKTVFHCTRVDTDEGKS